mmetsp:Transcript_28841/g.66476  ORF Transcript_28841/g.66476 Transcript_28841/m.66476 type:complete len:264 (-) Transcript_28841:41-832(-)
MVKKNQHKKGQAVRKAGGPKFKPLKVKAPFRNKEGKKSAADVVMTAADRQASTSKGAEGTPRVGGNLSRKARQRARMRERKVKGLPKPPPAVVAELPKAEPIRPRVLEGQLRYQQKLKDDKEAWRKMAFRHYGLHIIGKDKAIVPRKDKVIKSNLKVKSYASLKKDAAKFKAKVLAKQLKLAGKAPAEEDANKKAEEEPGSDSEDEVQAPANPATEVEMTEAEAQLTSKERKRQRDREFKKLQRMERIRRGSGQGNRGGGVGR